MIALWMDRIPLPWWGGHTQDAIFVAPSEKEARELLSAMFEPWPGMVNEIIASLVLADRTSVRTWYIHTSETNPPHPSLRGRALPCDDSPEVHLVTCTVGEFLDATPATGMHLFRHTE